MLRAILDGVPAMIAYWDRDLRNTIANAAHVEWFGLEPEEMPGMHISEVIGPELYEQNRTYLERALAGESQLFDRLIVDAQGRSRHTQAAYVPDVVGGEVRGFFVLVTDVTARVVAEAQVRANADEYRALVRSIPGGFVLLFDMELRFRVAEGEALALFGFAPEALEGRLLDEAFPAALAHELRPRYLSALAGRSSEWDRAIGERVFHLIAGPVRNREGEVFAGTVVCTDVTQQRRSAAEAQALQAIATLVAANASVDAVVEVVAARMHDVFRFEQSAVIRFTSEQDALIVALCPPLPSLDPELVFLPDDPSAVAAVARTGAPALARYGAAEAGSTGRLYAHGLRSGAAAPIRIQGRLWGAVALGSIRSDAIDRPALEGLASFAHLVELALGNAALLAELNRQATSDAVTGLLNRRGFYEHLNREVAAARRSGAELSVIVIDIDHFKAVNDVFGHPAGDVVLAEVGRRLTATAREHEPIGRIGGEEFTWLLSGVDAELATTAAERARRAIADLPFEGVGSLTVSAGVCALDATGSVERLMSDADDALYRAKRAGRDRTVMHRPAIATTLLAG